MLVACDQALSESLTQIFTLPIAPLENLGELFAGYSVGFQYFE